MVKRRIDWSNRARIKLYEILEYYTERNKSSAYSEILYKKFSDELALLIKHPEIGRQTDYEGVRGLILDDFVLYYEEYPQMVVVHTQTNLPLRNFKLYQILCSQESSFRSHFYSIDNLLLEWDLI